jgi:hypothetical protein
MYQQWICKGRIPLVDTCKQLNWGAMEEAMKLLKITCRHWVAKHISGHCGVNAQLLEWGHSHMDKHPCCGKVENAQHIWLCQAPEACVLKLQSIMKLRKHLHDSDTEANVCCIIMSCVASWSFNTQQYLQCTCFPGMHHFSSKEMINWPTTCFVAIQENVCF